MDIGDDFELTAAVFALSNNITDFSAGCGRDRDDNFANLTFASDIGEVSGCAEHFKPRDASTDLLWGIINESNGYVTFLRVVSECPQHTDAGLTCADNKHFRWWPSGREVCYCALFVLG